MIGPRKSVRFDIISWSPRSHLCRSLFKLGSAGTKCSDGGDAEATF
jgi:hypothetical protein